MHRTYQCVLAHIRACLGAATPAGIPVQSTGGETPVILHPFVATRLDTVWGRKNMRGFSVLTR